MAQQTLCSSLWLLKDNALILLEHFQDDCQHLTFRMKYKMRYNEDIILSFDLFMGI